MPPRPKTLLVLSQVYIPDPASVGQHIADAASEMAARGHRVIALASADGYDDPSKKYPIRETLRGVQMRRFRYSSFGKGSIAVRLIGGSIFLAQAVLYALFRVGKVDAIMVSTSPPPAPLAAVLLSVLKRAKVSHWSMDLNPDQMIALGKTREGSLPARAFDWINQRILKRAYAVVALDRFMAERLRRKRDISAKLHIFPPWPMEEVAEPIPHEQNPFRAKHNLAGKFVVMYSGNHGPSNPIGTAIEAAKRLAHGQNIVFMFIGGGIGKKEVEAAIAAGATNIVSLPYQPLSELKFSLSAADVHLVTVGNEIVGIVHPCKVYGAMAVGRPIMLLGPSPSHVADLLERHDIGWHVRHGDVDGAVRAVEEMAAAPRERLEAMGLRAKRAIEGELSKKVLCGRFCDILEASMGLRPCPPPGDWRGPVANLPATPSPAAEPAAVGGR